MRKRLITALTLAAALVLAPVSGHLTAITASAENSAVEAGTGRTSTNNNTQFPGSTDTNSNTQRPGGTDTNSNTVTPTPVPDTPTPEPDTPTPAPDTPAPSPDNTDSDNGSDNGNSSSNSNSNSNSNVDNESLANAIIVAEDGMYDNVHVVWNEVNRDITAAAERLSAQGGIQNVDVIMGRSLEVPTDILSRIAGSNLTLALHMGRGLALSITGSDIMNVSGEFRLNLVASTIPAQVRASVMENVVRSHVFSFDQQGALPFHVNMHMNFGEENVGRLAVLYRYDITTQTMVMEGTFVVNSNGQAMFGLNRGGQYVAVVAQHTTYTVMSGDTFGRIASRHGMTTAELKALNPDVRNINRIRVGQVLNLY